MDSDKKKFIEKIDRALDDIRPHLAIDGGDVEVLDFEDGIVSIKWLGNCQNCNMTEMTLKAGLEHTLKSKIPEVKKVVAPVKAA